MIVQTLRKGVKTSVKYLYVHAGLLEVCKPNRPREQFLTQPAQAVRFADDCGLLEGSCYGIDGNLPALYPDFQGTSVGIVHYSRCSTELAVACV